MNRIIIGTLAIMLGAMYLHCMDTNKRYKEMAKSHSELRDQYTELSDEYTELTEYYNLLQEDFNMIWEENNIFTSMLGEIETVEGGSEIVSELWDRHHNHEIE